MPSRTTSWRRAGVTLIELLVVISILLVLAVLLARALPGVLESRRVREAARLVNIFLGTARNRAVETGRPVAVVFFRDPNLPQACVKLQQAEMPPPYAGDYTDSRILFMGNTGNVFQVRFCGSDWRVTGELPFPAALTQDPQGAQGEGLVNIGDQLQLNYQGHIWAIADIRAGPPLGISPTWYLQLTSPTGGTTSNIPANTLLPFQFFRQPVPSLVPPVTLPERTVVDLYFSGTADMELFQCGTSGSTADLRPVSLIFSPSGNVQGHYDHGVYHPAISPLYFLIGRRDRVTLDFTAYFLPNGSFTPAAEDGFSNLEDGNNLWITVSPQTAMINTNEVGAIGLTPEGRRKPPPAQILDARRFAREAQRMGGQ